MKNIFLYNKPSNEQDLLDVNNLTINQSLKLAGADPHELLVTDANSNVITFNNGSARYLLEIDQNNLRPAWTNNVSLDTVKTNTLNIPGTQQADILVIGDNTGDVDRFPRGLNNQVLVVDNATFGLNYKFIKDILNLPVGKTFIDNAGNFYTEQSYFSNSGTVAFITSLLLHQLSIPTIAGRKYTTTVSWLNTQPSGNNTYSLSIDGQGTVQTFVTTSTQSLENITWSWTSNITGTTRVQLLGAHLPNTSSGAITRCHIIVNPLGV